MLKSLVVIDYVEQINEIRRDPRRRKPRQNQASAKNEREYMGPCKPAPLVSDTSPADSVHKPVEQQTRTQTVCHRLVAPVTSTGEVSKSVINWVVTENPRKIHFGGVQQG